jgi:hypothetical protein
MPVKQFDGRIGPRPHNRVGMGECFCKTRKGFCHFWMSRLEMLLPFCSKPNRPIMDVDEKLHGYIYALLTPNGCSAGLGRAATTAAFTLAVFHLRSTIQSHSVDPHSLRELPRRA